MNRQVTVVVYGVNIPAGRGVNRVNSSAQYGWSGYGTCGKCVLRQSQPAECGVNRQVTVVYGVDIPAGRGANEQQGTVWMKLIRYMRQMLS